MQIEKHDGVVQQPLGTRRSAQMPQLLPLPSGAKPKTRRRTLAYNRLLMQLHSNLKPQKMSKGIFGDGASTIYINLTEHDRIRIVTELETLKTKI